jgi:hypothetical protein
MVTHSLDGTSICRADAFRSPARFVVRETPEVVAPCTHVLNRGPAVRSPAGRTFTP